MMPTIYPILGIVKSVKRDPGDNEGSTIKVIDSNTQKENNIICPFFCPTKKDDILAGMCISNDIV